jgi:hypothetical protein
VSPSSLPRDHVGVPTDSAVPAPDFDRAADCYRRRILCRATGPGTVVADLEDDFHHFRVAVGHDGRVVRSLECESLRWPWSTCPDAARNLAPLVGSPLPERFTDAARAAEPRANCTHQLDLAAHALCHAWRVAHGRGDARRCFDIEVPRADVQGRAVALLWIDGVATLRFRMHRARIVGAEPPFDSAPPSSFMAWADATLDPETAEAGIALRRGATIAFGRGWSFDDYDHAGQVEIGESGVCYTMTPGRSASALRIRGTVRDFAAAPERLVGGPSAHRRVDTTDPHRRD